MTKRERETIRQLCRDLESLWLSNRIQLMQQAAKALRKAYRLRKS